MANIKQWATTFCALGKVLGQVVIAEWDNENSPFKNHQLDKTTFNQYMAWVEKYECGFTRYGQRLDGKYRFFEFFNTFDGYDRCATPKQAPEWFVSMVNEGRDFFLEKSRLEWISYSSLIKDRKWSRYLAEKHLPEPEHSYEYQKGAYTKMYKLSTILAIEQTPEFQKDWAILLNKRKNS